jgi:small subunit ribosomal protein S17
MADEEKTDSEEQAAEDAPATEAEPQNDDAAGDTPREAADEAADVDVDEAPEADEAEAAAEEPEAAAPAPAAEPEEPAEQLGPKERRRRERSAHSGEALPPRTVEERIAERAEARKAKAAERRRYRQGRGKARRQAAGERTGTAPVEREPGNPKVRQGIVVSDKADKTITVRVESARRHPSYEKIIRRSKMVHAHDERNEAGPGDTVRLIETRPMSKTKHWRLTEILEKAK